MANIKEELAAIMAAVYGEEVRGSIHDAIAKINEVSEATLTIGTDITEPTSSVEGYFEKSVYINSETNDVWLCTGDAWELQGNIKGDKGDKGERGATWYRGTTVAGKSVAPKSFDIQSAEGDMYINVTEQSIYHCTEGGRPSKWSYDFTMSAGGGGGSVDIDGVTITENAAGEIQVADAITTKLDKLDENGQLPFDDVKGKPTTLSGYGVTDAYTKAEVDDKAGEWHKFNGVIEYETVSTANTDSIIYFHNIVNDYAYDLYADVPTGELATLKSTQIIDDINSTITGKTLMCTVNTPSVPTYCKLRIIK